MARGAGLKPAARGSGLTLSGDVVAVLGAAFQIGRSALAAYQSVINVTGQNIANVDNADYARQSGRLAALHGVTDYGASPGAGIEIAALTRHIDQALESRLRMARGDQNAAQTKYGALSQVEALYNELTEYDLSTQLNSFFQSFSDLATDPTETTTRDLVLSAADAVVQTLRRLRTGVLTQIDDLNDAATQTVTQVNQITSEVARLNTQIVATEARAPGGAAALRDRRDGLLRDLGELVEVRVREQDNGLVTVYAGSEPLVDFDRARAVTTQTTLTDGVERISVRFADNGGSVLLRGGKLAALAETRDTHLVGQLDQLDELAAALIYEVNRVHTQGRGLIGYANLTGTYAVTDAGAALNSTLAGLPFPVRNGTLFVHVRDQSTGETISRMIEVDLDGLNDDDTTLATLASALGSAPHITAGLTTDNRLTLVADAGYEISFSEDTSGALAALGIGTFFDGIDAGTLTVRTEVASDGRRIAASASGAEGDGTNANLLALVGEQASDLLQGASVLRYHESLITTLGADTSAAQTEYDAASAVYDSLLAQREATSGVSLDEESIKLTQYETAYEGAARFISVLQSLSASVLEMV